MVHDSVEPNELWHRRLAHVHDRALPLASKDIEGLPEIQANHGVCKGCVKGKNTKKTFPSSESKAKGILEIIHSDVCGPLSGYVYYVSFIDDFVVVGEQEGGLYKLKGHLEQALIHDTIEPNELWHRRLAHVHYRALPLATKSVEGSKNTKKS